VVCGRNAIAQLGVANGTRGTVTALDPHAHTLTIGVDGKAPREVILPPWYLDGRGRGERNRRVDLAYATTGHRAQGLTRWRALVRLPSQEDVNWLYVQLSHARHETNLYPVVGPEPQGPAGRGRPAAGGPVVAVRVRASVGRPGASAHAEYRRRRATERVSWAHSLPWRAGAVLGGALTAELLGAHAAPHLAGLLAVMGAAGLGWWLRFRPSADTLAWRRGAAGERRTARLLVPLEHQSWAVLHDLAIPGSQANIDHLVIGPGGVLVIDSKQYRGATPPRPARVPVARPPPARLGPAQSPVGGRPSR
jgi:hypothetical protein